MDNDEYTKRTLDLMRGNRVLIDYFIGHLPRFLLQKGMIDNYVNLGKEAVVFDCGTFFPFISWYCVERFGCDVRYTGLEILGEDIPGVRGFNSNIIFEDYGESCFDFVILTEVLEHLPCNLFEFRDRVIRSVKPGGYLLVSYPCAGKNAQDYDMDIPGKSLAIGHEHLREFTTETAAKFIGLPVLNITASTTPLYNAQIEQYLYRKEA